MSSDSDTWSKLQEHKRKHENLKERLAKRRQERQGLLASIPDIVKQEPNDSTTGVDVKRVKLEPDVEVKHEQNNFEEEVDVTKNIKIEATEDLVKLLSSTLCHKELSFPATVSDIEKFIHSRQRVKSLQIDASHKAIAAGLEKLDAQNLVTLQNDAAGAGVSVVDVELLKLQALHGTPDVPEDEAPERKPSVKTKKVVNSEQKDAIESLLSQPTMKQGG